MMSHGRAPAVATGVKCAKPEDVVFTYQGDGDLAAIGTEGYAINFELREGKQHCQKGTVEFLQETIKLCHKLTDKPLLIRLDSGNDSIDNVAVLMEDVYKRQA